MGRLDTMNKVAIIVYAGTDSHADLGRLTNALVATREFKDAGDDVKLLFDGGGTAWLNELKEDHAARPLFEKVRDKVEGACAFCAGQFDAEKSAKEAEVALLDEFDGHPSLRGLVDDGYQIITF